MIYSIFNDLFFPRLSPRIKRTIHEFAEQEIAIPKGDRKGMMFDIEFMPFTRFILDAIMNPYWRRMAIVGPTQAGKSLLANNIPMLYFLFEAQEDIIVGMPHMDLARGIWQEKILPVILGTKYRELLPDTGAGARGGTPTAIQFKNGVWLRFMGAGGGDAQRSSHTARIIIMTEVDKMDDPGDASEEADPVSQIAMRADSYEESKIIMECTVTHEHGRIWQEAMIMGSGGQIYVPCPDCGLYQPLIREGLIFDEKDSLSAEETARYKCSGCESMWTDSMRRQALMRPVLAHRDQKVNLDGSIEGELPRTRTFGLHYNVLYSPMSSLGKIAGEQWNADKSELTTTKKAMVQSKWAIPWVDNQEETRLSYSYLRAKAGKSTVALREVPDWLDWVIMEVDVQKRWLYWHTEAYKRDGTSQLIEYGIVDIVEETDRAVVKALDEVYDISQEGWAKLDDDGNEIKHIPKVCLLDTAYRYDIIGPWLKGKTGWHGVRGYGHGVGRPTGEGALFQIPDILQIRRQPDGNLIWFISVNQTKAIVHDRYLVEPGQPGYTYLPQDVTHGYLMSLTAEQRQYSDTEEGFVWVKQRKRNDYLDCRSYGVAASMYLAQRAKRDDAKLEARVEANKKMNKNSDAPFAPRTFIPGKRLIAQPKGKTWFNTSGRMFT